VVEIVAGDNQSKGSKQKRIRIPLGIAANGVFYGSLYGRGTATRLARKQLDQILEENGLSREDFLKAIKEGRYRFLKHKD
jgi:hypothetical protein